MQGYLFKLPKAFLDIFGVEAAPRAVTPRNKPSPERELGCGYREADELAALAERDPFAVDPTLVERGVRGHATTQNHLAKHLRSLGIEPRSPTAAEPNFDIAWQVGESVFVAEVKSLTARNEEKQLRLGLGQVLRYAQQLGPGAGAVLVVERQPSDASWGQLCQQLGIVLAWPEIFSKQLSLPTAKVQKSAAECDDHRH